MKRFVIFVFAVLTPLFCVSSRAEEQQPIAELKAGADFIWEITKLNDRVDVVEYFNDDEIQDKIKIKIQLDKDSVGRIPMILKSIGVLKTHTIEPKVVVIQQIWIARDLGNQKVFYRLESVRGDARFFEVHMMGKTSKTIDGIKEVNATEITNILADVKKFEVSQKGK